MRQVLQGALFSGRINGVKRTLEAASGFEPEYGALQHPYPCACECLSVPGFRGFLYFIDFPHDA